MSSLLERGVRPDSLELHGGAQAEAGLGSSERASDPLPAGSLGRGSGVFDQLSEGVDRWHRYGGVSFCGVPVAQYWAEFCLWESLLNERRYETIVELGTFEGGFSLYLDAQARFRDMYFRTYDIKPPARDIPGFVQSDIYRDAQWIGAYMQEHSPVIVFCDGGNKPRELKTFSRYVTVDSTLVVHDWGTEMLLSDVPDNVEMIHEEWCVEIGSASRVFRVRA